MQLLQLLHKITAMKGCRNQMSMERGSFHFLA